MEVTEEKLQDAISSHPTMRRLSTLCDALEKVLKRKSIASLTEPDSTERAQAATDRAREAWKQRAKAARGGEVH
jgi:hypothetical protein